MSLSETIAAMLTENTGRHFLDSGDAYGRHWQRNQGREFENEPATTLSFRHGEISVTHNVYHWLKERMTEVKDGAKAMDVLERYLRLKTGDDYTYYDLRNEFPEFFRVWQARKDWGTHDECSICEGYGEVDADVEEGEEAYGVTCKTCGGTGRGLVGSLSYDEKKGIVAESPYEVSGIYGEGNPVTENTYNEENLLSQDLLYTFFTMEGTSYVVLQIHGGCDARGGHTRPVLFECEEDDFFNYKNATIGCTHEGPCCVRHEGQEFLPGLEKEECDRWWYTDDGYHFMDQEGFKNLNLEKYETLCLDEGDEVLEWVPGKLCYVQADCEIHGEKVKAGTGFCPCCGGILGAGY